jgi:L-aspartate oxidase
MAALREETRGGHVRSDFVDRDDAHWRGHTYAFREVDGSVATSFHPITSRVVHAHSPQQSG